MHLRLEIGQLNLYQQRQQQRGGGGGHGVSGHSSTHDDDVYDRAITYDVKPDTGGILVCCEHGVVTHTGTKADYWVPWDKYIVQAKKDVSIPLPSDLQTVRDMVLSGKFQETSADCPRISYSVYHQRSINAISPPKKTRGCKCRGGKCGKACGCRKKQFSCTSGCSCNGNCCG